VGQNWREGLHNSYSGQASVNVTDEYGGAENQLSPEQTDALLKKDCLERK